MFTLELEGQWRFVTFWSIPLGPQHRNEGMKEWRNEGMEGKRRGGGVQPWVQIRSHGDWLRRHAVTGAVQELGGAASFLWRCMKSALRLRFQACRLSRCAVKSKFAILLYAFRYSIYIDLSGLSNWHCQVWNPKTNPADRQHAWCQVFLGELGVGLVRCLWKVWIPHSCVFTALSIAYLPCVHALQHIMGWQHPLRFKLWHARGWVAWTYWVTFL